MRDDKLKEQEAKEEGGDEESDGRVLLKVTEVKEEGGDEESD